MVYLRTNLKTGEEYVGQAKSPGRFKDRMNEHARKHEDAEFEFEVLGQENAGTQLDRLEERLDPGQVVSRRKAVYWRTTVIR